MDVRLAWAWAIASISIATFVAIRALRHRSLSTSGAIAGVFVLSLSLLCGARFGALILAFFFTSSKLTKYGSERKRNMELDDYKDDGNRNWVQVLVNSIIATILSIGVAFFTGWEDKCLDSEKSAIVTGLLGGILGHYACCNGDTWSSEIGVLSSSQPRLVTSFRAVPRGTNGAITVTGLLAASAGGAFIGLVFVLSGLLTTHCDNNVWLKQWLAIPLAAFGGLFGSLLDSFLGATVQFTGFCVVRKKIVGKDGPTIRRISGHSILDNNGVNFVSILIVTVISATTCLIIF